MDEQTGTRKQSTRKTWSEHSAGRELRERLFDQITPVLHMTECIPDASTRLVIQAYCLDMVSALEEVIARYELDNFPGSIQC